MSGVSGVSGGTNKPFDREEEAELRADASTSTLMNRVRQHAGRTGEIDLRGDDKTRREVSEEHKGHVGVWGGAELAKSLVVEGSHFTELAGEGAFAAGGVIGGAVGSLFLYGQHVRTLEKEKAELQTAIAKDELHVTLLSQLDLPQGYKDIQVRRRPDAGQSFQSDAQKMATQLASRDRALVPVLQLHADRGMHAALDLRASGMTKDAFLSANPKIADAYAKDAAFREGFDAIGWAAGSDLEEAKQKLLARDARYAATHVSTRI